MFTDMVGSTASAQVNEAAALKLRDEQAALVRPLFAAHQGREIKSMGDGFLAEFDSALRAVQCAIDIQQHLQERNSQPGAPPIQIRIGIHLGDVEQRESDIFGDAVNIAARIEPLANAGGVCISGEVYSQIRSKIPNQMEKLPPTALKGLQVSVDLYRVVLPWTSREPPSVGNGPLRLAVLPFTNMSPDPADSYFADGLTEELITVLSQLRELRVIARTSVMQYKSAMKAASQIGAELGVSSILEGSVRRAGNRLRITAQLIDVDSQEHIWAKSYDRELADVFAVQTEIAQQVAEGLKIELRPSEAARLGTGRKVRSDSYLAYLKGRTLLHERSEPALKAAKEQFELAISLDGRNASAYSGLSDVTWLLVRGAEPSRAEGMETSRALAVHALELDPGLAEAHASLALALFGELQFAEAEKEFLLALSLNPSYPSAHHWYAILLESLGRPEDALQELALAEQADPRSSVILSASVYLLIWLRRLDEAYSKIEKVGEAESFGQMFHACLYNYYVARSDLERARQEMGRYNEIRGEYPLKLAYSAAHYARTGQKDRALELLRQAEAFPESVSLKEATIAAVYAELNDLDGVFRWLDQAVEKRAIYLGSWRLDPRAEHVRRDPRFQALLKRMNLA